MHSPELHLVSGATSSAREHVFRVALIAPARAAVLNFSRFTGTRTARKKRTRFGSGGVAGGHTADYVYTARRNNSLSSSGRLVVFGFILAVSVGIAALLSVALGAWPILPFAGIEMIALYAAFRYIDHHANDYERITIKGNSVEIEVRDGRHTTHIELDRYWAQVEHDRDGSVLVRSRGREVALGRHLRHEQRGEFARELKRELRNWSAACVATQTD
jgi:uncharacterized membrane protein